MKKLLWILVLAALFAATAGPVLADTVYVVQPGDTLYRIAARFGVSVPAIVAANGLANPNLIYVGQRLSIPGSRLGATPVAVGTGGRYVVQPGDTLWSIARSLGTTVPALMTANGLTSARIHAGQTLSLPAYAAPTATSAPSATPCAIAWFFANPPVDGCPATAPRVSQAAAQRFERGMMVWLGQPEAFYVFHAALAPGIARLTLVPGPIQIAQGGSVDHRVGGAPAGLFEPVSGFGLLWRGEVADVTEQRSALGWATQPEYAFEAALQCQAYANGYPSPTCFLRGPAGEVINFFYMQYFGYYWLRWS